MNQEIKDLYWPDAGNFNRVVTEGTETARRIFDSTGARGLEKFAAVMDSLLVPRVRKYQRLVPSNEHLRDDRQAQRYFDTLSDLILKLRRRPDAHFYTNKNLGHMSLGAFGEDCMHVMRIGTGISYRYIHVGDVWVALNDRGEVDSIYYKFDQTAKQARDRWGDDRLPPAAKKAWDAKKPFEMNEYMHVVKPRRDFVPGGLGPRGMPFESWEISLDDKEAIRVPSLDGFSESGGMEVNPYAFSRYNISPHETRGRGPASLTLPDNHTLQEMESDSLQQGHLAVAPPLLSMGSETMGGGTVDSSMQNVFELIGGAMNQGWLDSKGRPKIVPFENRYNFPVGEAMMDKKRAAINDPFLLNLFQILIDHPQMTATEALLRAEEKGILIAPNVTRQQGEMLGPVTAIELDIIFESGWAPEPPGIVLEAAGEYELEYESSATRLAREEEIQAIQASVADLGPLTELDPTAHLVLNAQESAKFILRSRGVPPKLIRSDRELADEIQAQAAEAARQEAVETLPAAAKAVKDLTAANQFPGDVIEAGAAV